MCTLLSLAYGTCLGCFGCRLDFVAYSRKGRSSYLSKFYEQHACSPRLCIHRRSTIHIKGRREASMQMSNLLCLVGVGMLRPFHIANNLRHTSNAQLRSSIVSSRASGFPPNLAWLFVLRGQ
ncbi:hypothetical protein F5Y17DRAFT_233436 [Xylariaceae sp. FL0594]|nr:hypothetical protein F5Y17DRAFT_233436 [Xylariaceae sp. FL0594]